MEKKLTKSNNKRLTGVCGGIAEYMGYDPTIVRAIYAVLSFSCSFFPGFVLYIILSIAFPDAPEQKAIEQSSHH